MNSHYLYLSLDLFAIIFPFLASFYPKAPFYKKWRYLWIAIAVPAVFFIVWDEIFTQWQVWGFRERYVTGIHLGSLPLEEVLFFICVPYACVFTYFSINYLVQKDYFQSIHKVISHVLVALMIGVGVLSFGKAYTSVTFILLGLFIAWLAYRVKPGYMGRFYFAYMFILIPFFLINGVLTGSWIEGEVVWYDDAENLGIRMGTIPVEDTFYGMLLILMNVAIFEWLQGRDQRVKS